MSWVQFPVTTGLFTFLYFCLQISKAFYSTQGKGSNHSAKLLAQSAGFLSGGFGYPVPPSLLYLEFVHQRGIRYAARKHTCKEFTLLLQQAANYSMHNQNTSHSSCQRDVTGEQSQILGLGCGAKTMVNVAHEMINRAMQSYVL